MIIDENGMPLRTIFFKTPYNHSTDCESRRTATEFHDISRTQQHFKEEADINTIVNRFLKTGVLPQITTPPSYEDFDDIFDFQGAMDLVNQAQASFMQLTAEVRNTFQNDPGKFLAYVDHCKDTGDMEPLRKMGLGATPAPDSGPGPKPGDPPPPDPLKASGEA